jgi:hypothetical protein
LEYQDEGVPPAQSSNCEDVFITEAPGVESQRTLSNNKSNVEVKKMLRSIAPESKESKEVALQNRELVFSNVEVEMAKKKTKSKYTHYKALFNLNKSLLLKSSDENS